MRCRYDYHFGFTKEETEAYTGKDLDQGSIARKPDPGVKPRCSGLFYLKTQ